MADVKISQLPVAASSAGTDILPIVQGGITKQLAVQNLVPQNLKSNATTGVLQIVGPAAASTRVMTIPNANFTAARTDAAQSFTGDQTLSTGNLVVGTSGKGIDFSAVVHSGSTSKLLADYEVGTWTPTLKDSGNNACTLTTANGKYIKVGNQVTIWFQIVSSTNLTDANYYQLQSLPFAPPSGTFATGTAYSPTASVGRSCTYRIDTDTTAMYIRIFYANGAATNLSFANSVSGTVTYYV